MKKIILASKSPRRIELMKFITKDFISIPSLAEEIVPAGIELNEVSSYLAKIKANDIFKSHKDSLVIGCDTVVVLNNKVLGKPKDEEEAYEMLSMLSGNTHKVITGCCLLKDNREIVFSCETKVGFYPLSCDEIKEYIATGEPFDKAGGYGIQEKGALFVKGIVGDYFNVVGLPVSLLNKKLKTLL